MHDEKHTITICLRTLRAQCKLILGLEAINERPLEVRTEPVAVEIDGDKRRWNCEIVDEREDFEEKTQLVRSSKKLDDTNVFVS